MFNRFFQEGNQALTGVAGAESKGEPNPERALKCYQLAISNYKAEDGASLKSLKSNSLKALAALLEAGPSNPLLLPVIHIFQKFPEADKSLKASLQQEMYNLIYEKGQSYFNSKNLPKALDSYTLLATLPLEDKKKTQEFFKRIGAAYEALLPEGMAALKAKKMPEFYRAWSYLMPYLLGDFNPGLFAKAKPLLKAMGQQYLGKDSLLLMAPHLARTEVLCQQIIDHLGIDGSESWNAKPLSMAASQAGDSKSLIREARFLRCRAFFLRALIKLARQEEALPDLEAAKLCLMPYTVKSVETVIDTEALKYKAMIERTKEKLPEQVTEKRLRYLAFTKITPEPKQADKLLPPSLLPLSTFSPLDLYNEALELYQMSHEYSTLTLLVRLGNRDRIPEMVAKVKKQVKQILARSPDNSNALQHQVASSLMYYEFYSEDASLLRDQALYYTNLLIALEPRNPLNYFYRAKLVRFLKLPGTHEGLLTLLEAIKLDCLDAKASALEEAIILAELNFQFQENFPEKQVERAKKLLAAKVTLNDLALTLDELQSLKVPYPESAYFLPLMEWLLVRKNERLTVDEKVRQTLLQSVRELQFSSLFEFMSYYFTAAQDPSTLATVTQGIFYTIYRQIEIQRTTFAKLTSQEEKAEEKLISFKLSSETELPSKEEEEQASKALFRVLEYLEKGSRLDYDEELSFMAILRIHYIIAALTYTESYFAQDIPRLRGVYHYIAERFPSYAAAMQAKISKLGSTDINSFRTQLLLLIEEAQRYLSDEATAAKAIQSAAKIFDFLKILESGEMEALAKPAEIFFEKLFDTLFKKLEDHIQKDQLIALQNLAVQCSDSPFIEPYFALISDAEFLKKYVGNSYTLRAYALTVLHWLAHYQGTPLPDAELRERVYSQVDNLDPHNEKIFYCRELSHLVKLIARAKINGAFSRYQAFLNSPNDYLKEEKASAADLKEPKEFSEFMSLTVSMLSAQEAIRKLEESKSKGEVQAAAEKALAANQAVIDVFPCVPEFLTNYVRATVRQIAEGKVPPQQIERAYHYASLALAIDASAAQLYYLGLMEEAKGFIEKAIHYYKQAAAVVDGETENTVADLIWDKLTLHVFTKGNYSFTITNLSLSNAELHVLEAIKIQDSNYLRASTFAAVGEYLTRKNDGARIGHKGQPLGETEKQALLEKVRQLQFDLHLKACHDFLAQIKDFSLLSETAEKSYSYFLERAGNLPRLWEEAQASACYSIFTIDSQQTRSLLSEQQALLALENFERQLALLKTKMLVRDEDKIAFSDLHRALYVYAQVKIAEKQFTNKNYPAALKRYQFLKEKFPSYSAELLLRINKIEQENKALNDEWKALKAAKARILEEKEKAIALLQQAITQENELGLTLEQELDQGRAKLDRIEQSAKRQASLKELTEEQSLSLKSLLLKKEPLEQELQAQIEREEKLKEENKKIRAVDRRQKRYLFQLLINKFLGLRHISEIKKQKAEAESAKQQLTNRFHRVEEELATRKNEDKTPLKEAQTTLKRQMEEQARLQKEMKKEIESINYRKKARAICEETKAEHIQTLRNELIRQPRLILERQKERLSLEMILTQAQMQVSALTQSTFYHGQGSENNNQQVNAQSTALPKPGQQGRN